MKFRRSIRFEAGSQAGLTSGEKSNDYTGRIGDPGARINGTARTRKDQAHGEYAENVTGLFPRSMWRGH